MCRSGWRAARRPAGNNVLGPGLPAPGGRGPRRALRCAPRASGGRLGRARAGPPRGGRRGPWEYGRRGGTKGCWVGGLVRGGLAALAAPFDSPALTGRRGPDFNTLRVGGEHGLLEYLAKVTDHRMARGIRHQLAAILAVGVVARLSRAHSVYACGQFAASMPPEAPPRRGIPDSKRLRPYGPPHPPTL